MNDVLAALATTKAGLVIAAIIGSALAVLLELKRHTWFTATLAVFSGAFVAFVATEPIITMLSLPLSAGYAVAGVLGIAGRNLIVWVLQRSTDPIALWKSRK